MTIGHISISELKSISEDHHKHFFDRDTMRFFNSRIESKHGWTVGKFGYFVTSERFDENHPRKYTIRKENLQTGETGDVGEFQQYSERKKALEELQKVIAYENLRAKQG